MHLSNKNNSHIRQGYSELNRDDDDDDDRLCRPAEINECVWDIHENTNIY